MWVRQLSSRMMVMALLVAGALLLVPHSYAQPTGATAPPATSLRHKGFTADVSAIAERTDREALLDALRRQIDICASAGLSQPMLDFFRSIPLVVVTKGGPHASAQKVVMSAELFPPNNPVLLHEYLHVYHFRRLSDGSKNAEILAFYQRARETPGLWPAGSYMLSNPGEYFAMTASVFLHGSAAREPFNRAALKAKQPAYYAWLERKFGQR